MVGALERYEALRVARGVEDLARVVDRHQIVRRRVEDDQRGAQGGDHLRHTLIRDVVQELPLDRERALGERHRHLALSLAGASSREGLA